MTTVQSINEYDKLHATVLTIGTFDGVHIGHRSILERLVKSANEKGLKSAVLTFFPHPRMVLQKDADIKLLNTIEEKVNILEQSGLDYLIVHPFTQKFSRLSATEFVRDLLVNNLCAKKIIIGYDHRFGRNRNANITDLIAFGATFDFEVEEITAQEIDDVSVSSTKIRKALNEGDVATATRYLGYPYMLTGTIKRGKGIGRQLNFPTANLHIDETYKLIPKRGAYVVQSVIDGHTVYGMMNIGFNPTVNDNTDRKQKESLEIHFFDFDEDLYDHSLQVAIIERLRDERKFESITELKAQLARDKEKSRSIISRK
ncbi:MAG: bifunctional riboflavin kinase/FAD synthetase [Maribacter sp.]|uniref:bifunctional riboflavin kinase/FAD synthetase n=1 Tax=Maribacter sp. 2307UL18-2 TaxID=3386274 RepID=UPI0039BCFBA2